MYKVLIVDDEILAIQFLENLVSWDELNCRIVGKAVTVHRALSLVQELQPDIVFMDIKMPGMNGLELSERIKRENRYIEIIILTAYQDFEFAQKAVKIGVLDFLVKHGLDADVLRETVKKAITRLDNQRRISGMMTERWMREKWEGKETGFLPPSLNGTGADRFRILIIRHESFFADPGRIPAPAQEDCTACGVAGCVEYAEDGLIFLLRLSDVKSENRKREWFWNMGSQLLEICERECIDPLLGIYSEEFSRLEEYGAMCIPLKKMNGCFFFQPHRLVFPEEYLHLPLLTPQWPSAPVNALREAFVGGRQKTAEFLRSVFQTERDDFLVDAGELYVLYELFGTDVKELPLYIRRLRSVSDLEKYSSRIGEYLNERFLREKGKDPRVRQAMDYISRHFKEDISSAVIAEYLQVSDGYLRKLFKQENGYTLKEYIQEYRVQMAKQYLSSGHYRISEIARMCGFKTSQHFSTVFKSVVGISPGAYGSEDRE